MDNEKPYEERSIADLAHRGLKRIRSLATSQAITDKLIALNVLLFVFILTFNIGYWLNPIVTDPLSRGIALGLGFVFSLIVSLAYGPILETIADLTINKIQSLRIAASILFTDLTIAMLGFLFRIELLLIISLIITAIQLLVLFLGSIIDLSKTKIDDKLVNPGQIKDILGVAASIITIINFIIWLITLLVAWLF